MSKKDMPLFGSVIGEERSYPKFLQFLSLLSARNGRGLVS